MNFPRHTLVQIGGKLAQLSGKAEIWTCGLRVYVGSPLGFYLRDPQAYADALAPKLKAWFVLPQNAFPSNATLEFVKVNNINPLGLYTDTTTHQAAISGAVGGAAAQGAPSFCSVALTLETGATRGLAARGRLYLPNYSYTPNGSMVPPIVATDVCRVGKLLLDIINSTNDQGALVKPIVVSSVGAGNTREITGVSADNVYDVQRRRKNRLAATRTTATWPS